MARGRYGQKKNRSQVINYQKFVKDGKGCIESTDDSFYIDMLTGSDENISANFNLNNTQIPVARIGTKLLVGDWVKEHLTAIIIDVIILAVLIPGITTIYKNEERTTLNEYRIQNIEEQLKEFKGDYTRREVFETKLEEIKDEAKNNENDIDGIDEKLDELEAEIQK